MGLGWGRRNPSLTFLKQINNMSEIYWITRLGYLHTISMIFMIIGIVACIILLIFFYISNGQMIYDDAHGYQGNCKEFKGYKNTCVNSLAYFIPIALFFTVSFILTPTTNEALTIYGVGGTIDYIKQNPTAKQIPDKCINALDKWVDTWTVEKDSIK